MGTTAVVSAKRTMGTFKEQKVARVATVVSGAVVEREFMKQAEVKKADGEDRTLGLQLTKLPLYH